MRYNKLDIVVAKNECGSIGLGKSYRMKHQVLKLDDFIKDCPFLDVNDNAYFERMTIDVLPSHAKVTYRDELYYVCDIVGFKRYISDLIFGNAIVPIYRLSRTLSKETPNETIEIPGTDIGIADYWYINSKGKIRSAVVNKDNSADIWRKKTGNFFNSITDCRNKLKEIEQNSYIS